MWFAPSFLKSVASRRPRGKKPAALKLRVEQLEDRTVPSITIFEAEPNNTLASANAVPLGFDAGENTALTVKGDIPSLGDRDWFRVDLNAGDVIGGTVQGQMGLNPAVRLFDSAGKLLIFNDDHGWVGNTLPPESPLPRFTSSNSPDSAFYYVVNATGSYFIEVLGSGDASTGKYQMDLTVARPGLEAQPAGAKQIVFVDFNGATVNMSKNVGDGSGNRTLSPLSSFLASWGLSAADENAVIDSILATLQENLSTDIRARGANPQFDVQILNSRDHADMFGSDPYVARLVIGGTLAEAGVTCTPCFAFAQNIDVGNFKFNDEAVVLLDQLSGQTPSPPFNVDLNAIPINPKLDPRLAKIALIGRAVGNIASHELGHNFGNFHTDRASAVPNIMDQGSSLGFPNAAPSVGSDGIFGTKDDYDRDYGVDTYQPGEFFLGIEDTLNVISFGLTTGKAPALQAAALGHDGVTTQLSASQVSSSGIGIPATVNPFAALDSVIRDLFRPPAGLGTESEAPFGRQDEPVLLPSPGALSAHGVSHSLPHAASRSDSGDPADAWLGDLGGEDALLGSPLR